MFRKEFADVISKTGMVPLKDLRPLLADKSKDVTELKLLELEFFDDVKFAKVVAEKYNITFIDLSNAKVADATLGLIKKSDAVKFRCIPIQKTAKAVSVAVFDPSIQDLKQDLQTLLQHNVEIILTNITSWSKLYARMLDSIDDLLDTIKEILPDSAQEEKEVKDTDIGEDIIRLVNRILAEAFVKKASDIHTEPYENSFRIRFRIDGSLQEVHRLNKKLMAPMNSRLKILSQMDISEKRKPQDGRIKLEIGGKSIDYRVSSLPCLFGEKICMRLLDKSNLQLDMTKLGFEKKQLEVFMNGIHQPFGMCLVTGPTGSGKTTTLYSALAELNSIDVNISTAEDPCEFNLEGINQVNVKKDIGLTFATALKAFLRQDPDIIMVGEIRDFETGEIAVEAALTGHMVLSTLHTNDAPSTIMRLVNMGIENFLVAGAVCVVVAQRLCRRICEACKAEHPVAVEEIVACGIAESSARKLKVYKGKGCNICNGTGYKGRVAIYEVLQITPAVKEIIIKNGTADDIKKMAIKEGMKTLRMCAMTKVALGQTTIDEAISNSSSDKF
jgi:type IV pilus assembly protein PilB